MSLLKRTASGFVWNHFGRISEYILLYFFSVIIARKLGAEVNGVYALLLSVVQILLIVSSFGLETSVAASFPKLLKDSPKEEIASTLRALLWIRIVAIAGISFVFFIVRDSVIHILNAPPLFVDILSVLILYYALRSIISLLTTVHIAKLETKAMSIAGVGLRGVEVLGAILLISSGFGLKEVFVLIICTSLVQAIVLLWLLREYLSGTYQISALGSIVSKGWKFGVNNVMEFLLGRQADVILLSYFLVTPMVIGYYDVALSFAQLINFGLTTGMYGISVASFASIAIHDQAVVSRYWNFLSRMVIFAVVPAFVFAIVFAESLIPLIYSSQYVSSILLFQIFSVFLIATRLLGGGIAADFFQATGKTNVLLLASAISGGANLMLAIVLIPRFQAVGAVFATGVGALMIAGIHAYYAARFLQIRFPIKEGLYIIMLSAVSAISVHAITCAVFGHNLIIMVFLYVGLFLLLCYLVKPLSPEDAELLRSMNEKLYSIAKEFVPSEIAVADANDSVQQLTDRQKWAYAWMPKSGIVVDVGPSSSPLCHVLAQKSVYAFAVDIDQEALEKLRQDLVPVQPIQASASLLPFPSGSVDTVLLLDVLEHVEDERKVIDEVQRVLRPGGKLILSVPYKGLFRFLDPENIRTKIDGNFTPATVHRHYSDADLTRLLFLRFRVLQQHYGGLFLYPLTFAANNFVQKRLHSDWSRFFKWLGDLDNDISWGRWSYNVMILAEKI